MSVSAGGSDVGTLRGPTAVARGSSGCPLTAVCAVSPLISGTVRKQSSRRRSPLARPAAARGMEAAAPAGR